MSDVLDLILRGSFALLAVGASAVFAADQVKVTGGALEGTTASDSSTRVFRGVPYAAPPVGDLRWRPPQAVKPWTGVRKASEFGARCVQPSLFSDMIFPEKSMSEDCLYLNIWTPARSEGSRLPVLVYFHGGGFAAGSGAEPRYSGENFARLGLITVTVNYRLGVLGFLSHPELTAESPHKASGNYGLLDQVAALRWVKANIAAFGGDPGKVTIGGESAGSFAVSALMASPLPRGLFRGAIGESGAFFTTGSGTLAAKSLADSEKQGVEFAAAAGAKSLAQLRAVPAEELLKPAMKFGMIGFSPNIDGYFLPSSVASIYAQGKQSRVPLLAGWNANEMRASVLAAREKATAKAFTAQVRELFKDRAGSALKLYPASSDEEALRSAGDLASDQFIIYCTWKWIEEHRRTGRAAVYRFRFDRAVPLPEEMSTLGIRGLAGHAWELEYVFGALDSKKAAWQPEDRKTSEAMAGYWANFVRTGDPNGAGLPKWPAFSATRQVMHLDEASRAAPEQYRDRYVFLDAWYNAPGPR